MMLATKLVHILLFQNKGLLHWLKEIVQYNIFCCIERFMSE